MTTIMQDHLTKWVEGRAIGGKEVLTVSDALVHELILKHGPPDPSRYIVFWAKTLPRRCNKESVNS